MKKNITIALSHVAIFCSFFIHYPAFGQSEKTNQSISIQVGINGVNNDRSSYGLQLLPPDIAYSREIFNFKTLNISGGVFYDNIGVKIKDQNFSYRFGARVDLGFDMGRYNPYITSGYATIRNGVHYQPAIVFGSGFLTKINRNLMWSNEINFQNVEYANSSYTIVNLSTGVNYLF